jgi:hypothetical protein
MAQIPNIAQPVTDPQRRATTPWYHFFMQFAGTGPGGGVAPANAGYVVGAANAGLPNARVAMDSATVDVDLTVPGVIRWHATSAGAWVPLTTGAEPLEFLSDGAGSPILVGYTP